MVQLAQIQKSFELPSSLVYRYVTDMENYAMWFPGVIGIRSVDELPVGSVGKRYLETLELPTGPSELTIEVKQAIPDKRFVTEGDLPQLLPRMIIDISADGNDGCLLTLTYESRRPDIVADPTIVDMLHCDLMARGESGLQTLQKILLR